jgi:iron complex transport system substrate-binding protein
MLKNSKRLFVILILCVFVLTSFSTGTFAQATIQVDINGKTVALGTNQPYLSGSAVMLPLKAISEALGANVSYDSVNKNITLLRGDNVYMIKQGSSKVYINGRTFKLGAVSVVKNGATYISQDFVSAVFGFQSSFDSTTSKLSIKIKSLPVYFSDSFRIEYLDNGCKLVNDGENRRLLLVPDGKTAPKNVKADAIISIPLKKVLAASSTQVGPLLKLGVLSSLKAVTTDGPDWITPEIKKYITAGNAKFVGGDGMGEPDYEQVKAVNPDMTFLYFGSYGQMAVATKLEEMDLNFAVNNEYLEAHYLGRMEWIKFMAAFYDKELVAEKILNDAVKEIDSDTSKVAGLKEPKIAWGNSYKGKVSIPNAGSYVGKWIDMAGGDYAFKDVGIGASSSTYVSMEEFYANTKDADILIYSSTVNYMQNPTIAGIVADNPIFANMKAVKSGNVYAYSADWWETIPETDSFVKSIAAVFHPDAFKGYTPAKLVKLPQK